MIVSHCHSSTDGQEKTNSLGTAFPALDHSCWTPETMIQVFIIYFPAVAFLTPPTISSKEAYPVQVPMWLWLFSAIQPPSSVLFGAVYVNFQPEICDFAF